MSEALRLPYGVPNVRSSPRVHGSGQPRIHHTESCLYPKQAQTRLPARSRASLLGHSERLSLTRLRERCVQCAAPLPLNGGNFHVGSALLPLYDRSPARRGSLWSRPRMSEALRLPHGVSNVRSSPRVHGSVQPTPATAGPWRFGLHGGPVRDTRLSAGGFAPQCHRARPGPPQEPSPSGCASARPAPACRCSAIPNAFP